MYRVADLFKKHEIPLSLTLIAGEEGLSRQITVPEAHRPGLSLSGYLKGHAKKRLLVLGRVEIDYLKDLSPDERARRLTSILTEDTPAVIVARKFKPVVELVHLCNQNKIPLFRTPIPTMSLLSKLTHLLAEEFAPCATCHGTLVEVFGVGVLIQGDSAVGKSEAALGLIERGHRLIADDVVRVTRGEAGYLEGYGTELTRHHMEIRGIGILNVAFLYGAVCVRDRKRIDMVVFLEVWDDNHAYDRVGLEDTTCDILDVRVPFHVLPVKPGRDVVLLLETLALNHRLKGMGLNSAKEFSKKLHETMAHKTRRRRT